MAHPDDTAAPQQNHCPSCDSPLSSSAPAGLCRRCLISSALQPPDEVPVGEEPLGEIGDYEIYERIAMGGMGAIYRARQRGLDREVAIKLIPEGRLAGSADVARFLLEAGAAAELDHPNIVPIYDVGEEDGQHYFSMRLVRGGTLEERSSEFSEARAAAGVVRKIAEAVHFAHQGGILHRDLKPANIFITRDGEPMVGDFGLAKRIGGKGANGASLTQTGQMLGSPAYIAPEIAAGKARASVGSDVYSLGVVFYQLLVGQVPFSGETQLDVIRQAVDREPPRPRSLSSEVPRDLETICLKCLEKDPAHRYPSAGEFAEDLERWLKGKAIAARPTGRIERGWKWAKRRPAAAALALVSLLAVAGLFVILLVSGAKIRKERDIAIAEGYRARVEVYSSDMVAVFDALDDCNLFKARQLVEHHRPAPGAEEDLRDIAWRIAWSRCQGEELHSIAAHDGAVTCLALSRDKKQLYSGSSQDGTVRVWDLDTREEVLRLPRDLKQNVVFRVKREAWAALGGPNKHGERIRNTNPRNVGHPISLGLINRGSHLAIGSSNSYVRLYNLEKGYLENWWPVEEGRLSMLPMSKVALVGVDANPIRGIEGKTLVYNILDPTSMEPIQALEPSGGFVTASPDGTVIATGSWDGQVSVFDSELRLKATMKHFTNLQAIAVRHHGTNVAASVSGRNHVDFWNVLTEKKVRLTGHKGNIQSLSYVGNGKSFASGSADQTIRTWHGVSGASEGVFKGHTGMVTSLLWLPDHRTLISGAGDGCIKFWDTQKKKEIPSWDGITIPHDLSADGEWVVGTEGGSQELIVARARDGSDLKTRLDLGKITAVRFCGDDRIGVLVLEGEGEPKKDQHGLVHLLDRTTLEAVAEPLRTRPASILAFSPKGDRMFLGFSESRHAFDLWDLDTRKIIKESKNPKNLHGFNYLEFTPDGTRIVGREWNHGGWVEVYDGFTGEPIHFLQTGIGSGFAVSPDGEKVAIGLTDNTIAIWDIVKGEREAVLTGHLYGVHLIAWSPDGKCVASAAGSGSIRMWHVPTWREIATLGKNRSFQFLKFGPKGETIFVKGYGGKMEVWEIPSFKETERPY